MSCHRQVAQLVAACSEPNKKLSWRERKEHTLEYLKTAPYDVKCIAAADKLHNIRAIARDYELLGEDLWLRFSAGKEEQEWYYRGLVANLASPEFRENSLYRQLHENVVGLFG